LAALASYYQRLQQPQNATKVQQAAQKLFANQVFENINQRTEIVAAMSAIVAATGQLPQAKTNLTQSLQAAKKQLSQEAYFGLTRGLANQLLFYGQPELMTMVIAAVPTDRQTVIQETLAMGLEFSGQFDSRLSSIGYWLVL
jgi:hypothetical protein